MSYTEAGRKAFEEATLAIPGILVAKQRKAPADVAVLQGAYMDTCKELGLNQQAAWSVLFNASIHWLSQLNRHMAQHGGKDPIETAQGMAELAVSWVGSEH